MGKTVELTKKEIEVVLTALGRELNYNEGFKEFAKKQDDRVCVEYCIEIEQAIKSIANKLYDIKD